MLVGFILTIFLDGSLLSGIGILLLYYILASGKAEKQNVTPMLLLRDDKLRIPSHRK